MKNEDLVLLRDIEVRAVGDGEQKKLHIQGYALTFDSVSEDLGYREIIRRGALDDCRMDNVVLNVNHSDDKVLARNNKSDGEGSLVLTVDENGLFFDAIPTNTSYARDLITNMESGIIGKCSFAFRMDWSDPGAQTWDWDLDGKRGYDVRTVNKIAEIRDCSIVVNPAYESTSTNLYKRSKEEHEKEKVLSELQRELELIEIENSI